MRPGFELGKGPYRVRAARLPGLAGTLSWPTQPEHVFAHELSGRVRVIAGLDQVPNLLHSEAWPDARGTRGELKRLRGRLRCGPDDAIVVVWGPEEDTVTACEEIRLRYVDAIHGVPNETRQPFVDGSTDFERILPGPDRMYPDTDSPPTRVTRDRVARLKASLPERPWDREIRYTKAGVPVSTAHFLIRRGGAALVDRLVEETGAPVRDVAFLFGEKLKGLRRASVPVDAIPEERWAELLRAFVATPVLKQAWEPVVLADRRRALAPRGRPPRRARPRTGAPGLARGDPRGLRRGARQGLPEGGRGARPPPRLREPHAGPPRPRPGDRGGGGRRGRRHRLLPSRTPRRCSRERDERPPQGLQGARARGPPQVRREGLERRPRRQRRRLRLRGGHPPEERVVRRPPPRDEAEDRLQRRAPRRPDRARHRGRVQGSEVQDPREGVPLAADAAEGDAPRDGRDDRLAPRLPDGRRHPRLHAGRALRRRARSWPTSAT